MLHVAEHRKRVMTVRSGLGGLWTIPTLKALDPDEGFTKDGALTVGVHMSVVAQVFFRL